MTWSFRFYRTPHGPVVSPLPYDPATYGDAPDPANPIVAWRYAHWGHEFDIGKALLGPGPRPEHG